MSGEMGGGGIHWTISKLKRKEYKKKMHIVKINYKIPCTMGKLLENIFLKCMINDLISQI